MTDDTAYRAVYLLLHDEDFLRAHKSLDPKVFPPGPMRYLSDLALRQWARYHNTVTASVLNQALEVEYTQLRKARATEEAVIRLYFELDTYAPDDSSIAYAREVCTAWLAQYALGAYIEQAGAALDRGDVEKAREKLSTALTSSTEDSDENVRLSAFIGQTPHGFSGAAIPTGLYDLDKLWEGGLHPGELGIILGPTGVGKALAVDTPLPTPTGWTTMGNVTVGDRLLDEQGLPCVVVAVSPVWEDRPRYALTFSDGARIEADADHEWLVGSSFGTKPYLQTSQQLYRRRNGARAPKTFVPVAAPLVLPPVEFPIDPYLLGIWLGDGWSRGGQITAMEEEIVTAFAVGGYSPHPIKGRYRIGLYGFHTKLRTLGLLGNKHVPPPYLRGSREQRLSLLQGLMDSDGTAATNGYCEISFKNRHLTENAAEIVRSLGMKAFIRENPARLYGKDCGLRHRLHFHARLPVFRLARKAGRLRDFGGKRGGRRQIKAVEALSPGDTRCVQVDSPSHLFLAGEHMVPTHNSMIAVNMAVEAFWKRQSVIYYTFELTPNQILRRAVTGILQKGARSLKWGRDEPLNATLWQTELLRATSIRYMKEPPTADIDVRTGLMTIRDLIHDIDEYIVETGQPPGLIVLDSADELVPERQRKQGWEELKETFSTLRGEVAQGREVPVWTTGQATREAVDKARISLKHVGASFAKAQKAHFVLGLAQTDQERGDVEGPWMNVFVLKDTHHGTTGGWLHCTATFGRGDNGFPGLEVHDTTGLPVSVGEEP